MDSVANLPIFVKHIKVSVTTVKSLILLIINICYVSFFHIHPTQIINNNIKKTNKIQNKTTTATKHSLSLTHTQIKKKNQNQNQKPLTAVKLISRKK